jgi:sugar-specific transcriptional regulator TrmB
MKDVSTILKSLGLADSEVKLYLAALENGASSVVDLAKQTGLSRQACYTAIEQMIDRSLMSSVQHGKKRLFVAEPPDKLLAYAKRKEQEMKERINDLKHALPKFELQLGGERPVVRMYEGKEGIRAFLDETRRVRPKLTREFADSDALRAVLTSEDLAPYQRELAKQKGKIKGIYMADQATTPSVVEGERVFIHHPKDRARADITVLGDRVGFVSLAGKMFTVILENKEIAKAVGYLIDLAYEEAKRNSN